MEKNKEVLKDVIEVKSYLPCILSGQYCDYKEGEIVSFLTNEFYLESKIKYTNKNKIIIENNGERNVFNLKEVLDCPQNEKGTLKSLLFGVYKTFSSLEKPLDIKGFKIINKSNIEKNGGFELNLLVNIFKAFNVIFDLKFSDFALAELIQHVYTYHFGKIIPLLNVISYFHKDFVHMVLKDRRLTIEYCDKHLNRYSFLMFKDGNNISLEQYNSIYNSEYKIFDKVKKFFNVNNLSDIHEYQLFKYVFIPQTFLNESEKLILTHYYEELKRSRKTLEGIKDGAPTRKLFDALNMSTTELGGYLSFNKFNKFLEVNVFKTGFKKECALTLLNEENLNKFVFTVESENLVDLFNYLKTLKFFDIQQLTINNKGIKMYQIY